MPCCDLFGLHESRSKAKSVAIISLEAAKNLENKYSAVKPGLKLCPNCFKHLKTICNLSDSSESENEAASVLMTEEIASHSKLNLTSVFGCSERFSFEVAWFGWTKKSKGLQEKNRNCHKAIDSSRFECGF